MVPVPKRKRKHPKGVGLIEIMVSIAILLVAVVGAMGYQYYTALDAKKADMHIVANRIAVLFLESWKAVDGDISFDPSTIDDEFDDVILITSSTNDEPPGELPTTLGSYLVQDEGISYFTTLSYDNSAASSPMVLSVTVSWDQRDYGDSSYVDGNSTITLTSFEGY